MREHLPKEHQEHNMATGKGGFIGASITPTATKGTAQSVTEFTSGGTYNHPSSAWTAVDVDICAGGGAGGGQPGGGQRGGMGGGGGAKIETDYSVSPGSAITVTIGSGGQSNGANGGSSSFGPGLPVSGGGYGSPNIPGNGNPGGAGGGPGRGSIGPRGSGTPGQGFPSGVSSPGVEAGGGGAGAVGGDGNRGGGVGVETTLTGTPFFLGAGAEGSSSYGRAGTGQQGSFDPGRAGTAGYCAVKPYATAYAASGRWSLRDVFTFVQQNEWGEDF